MFLASGTCPLVAEAGPAQTASSLEGRAGPDAEGLLELMPELRGQDCGLGGL